MRPKSRTAFSGCPSSCNADNTALRIAEELSVVILSRTRTRIARRCSKIEMSAEIICVVPGLLIVPVPERGSLWGGFACISVFSDGKVQPALRAFSTVEHLSFQTGKHPCLQFLGSRVAGCLKLFMQGGNFFPEATAGEREAFPTSRPKIVPLASSGALPLPCVLEVGP